MKPLTALWAAALALACTLDPGPASAQSGDTLTLTGTFRISSISGTVGDDLAGVSLNDSGRWWTLTAYGVTYSHDTVINDYYDYYGYYHYSQQLITRVHATSFDLEFFGPDADVLDAAVSQQLTSGSLTDGALLQLSNVYTYDEYPYWYYYWYYYYPYYYTQYYSSFELGLQPDDPAAGVSFLGGNGYLGYGYSFVFSTDADGFPIFEAGRHSAYSLTVADNRPDNSGALTSYADIVDFDSGDPPLPPTLRILDGSIAEGNKGTKRLDLTVTLSRISSSAVTVQYATADGTARSRKDQDYNKTSGTVTIPAGQTQGIVPVSIKGDRKREPNETFTVNLSGAVGATIDDGSATVTILNDD